MRFSIAEVLDDFPAYRVAILAAEGLSIAPDRPAELDALVRAVEADAIARYTDVPASEIPGIADWRRAYRAFGIKKTSYRSSVERLLRITLRDGALPRVNSFVDAYNAASLKHLCPMGADDLDQVVPPLGFRYARPGDSFVRLGEEDGAEDPPKDGEVVYADAEKVLCRRWNWSQDARSAVSVETKRAVLTVQGLEAADVATAADELAGWLTASCGGAIRTTVLDAKSPEADV